MDLWWLNLNVYDGTILAFKEDIIVASANYRLGAFGFLYYNDERIPGNAGLMDQILAIEWYKQNYETLFNAQNICLFGESAGAMSIHFHVLNLNEKTKDLFQCAIFQSGTAYLDFAYRQPNEAYEMTDKLVEISNCNSNKSKSAIIDCLKELDKDTLLLNQSFFYDKDYVNRYLPMPFIPTADYHHYLNVSPFDTKTTKSHLMKKYKDLKDFKFLLGINKDEGGFFLFYAYVNQYFNLTNVHPIDPYDEDFDRNEFLINTLAELLHTKKIPENNDLIRFTHCLNSVYRGSHHDASYDNFCEINIWKKVMKIIGDLIFSCPTIKLFDNLNRVNAKNNYFYKFSYSTSSNPWPTWMGTSHGMCLNFKSY